MSDSSQNLIIPFLGPVYRMLSPLAELALRIAIGGFLIPHGLQKGLGMFGGSGFGGTAGWLASMGMTPGWLWAAVAVFVEVGCGALILIGFLTRPAAALAFVFLMVAVISVHLQNGFFMSGGGYEYSLLWAMGAFFFMIRGAGPISIDRMLGREF